MRGGLKECAPEQRNRRHRRDRTTYTSSSSAKVSRMALSATGPLFPSHVRIRRVATDRTCWHWAADRSTRRFSGSGSRMTSVPLARTVRVSGTTCTTFGPPRSTAPAVTTTAGRRRPASLPIGSPRSTSTMSPGWSIKPRRFVVSQLGGKIAPHLLLPESSDRSTHRLVDRLVAIVRQPGDLLMRVPTDANRGRGAHTAQTRTCRQKRLQHPGVPRTTTAGPFSGTAQPPGCVWPG